MQSVGIRGCVVAGTGGADGDKRNDRASPGSPGDHLPRDPPLLAAPVPAAPVAGHQPDRRLPPRRRRHPLPRRRPRLLRDVQPRPPGRHRPGGPPPRLQPVPRLAGGRVDERTGWTAGSTSGPRQATAPSPCSTPPTSSTRSPTCWPIRSRPAWSDAGGSGPASGRRRISSAPVPSSSSGRRTSSGEGRSASLPERACLGWSSLPASTPRLSFSHAVKASSPPARPLPPPTWLPAPWLPRPRSRPRPAPLGQPRSHRAAPLRLNPRVACLDKWRRIQALGQLVQFLHDYRCALVAWRCGSPHVLFPSGTYLMRLLHDAPCTPSA